MFKLKANLWPSPLTLTKIIVPITLLVFFSTASAKEVQTINTTANLWMDMLIGPPLVPLFNQEARDDDIARVDHPSQVAQLSGITGGRKLVVFKSIADTEAYLPGIATMIDIVGYNLENSPDDTPR